MHASLPTYLMYFSYTIIGIVSIFFLQIIEDIMLTNTLNC